VERFRVGLVFEALRLVYGSTLGSRVIKKKVCACTDAWSSREWRSSGYIHCTGLGFRKSTLPPNRQLSVYCYSLKYQVDNFVGELTFEAASGEAAGIYTAQGWNAGEGRIRSNHDGQRDPRREVRCYARTGIYLRATPEERRARISSARFRISG
jgi:hypothetical protein